MKLLLPSILFLVLIIKLPAQMSVAPNPDEGKCPFSLPGTRHCWNRSGVFNIDIVSENFACHLIDSLEKDTILLCKYICNNGSIPQEKAFVLWQGDGKGFLKAFFNNEQHSPTENKIISFNWTDIYSYYFANEIDTVTSYPKSIYWVSHGSGYSVQFYSPGTMFFCSQMPDIIWQADKTGHPKAAFWKIIDERLKGIQTE